MLAIVPRQKPRDERGRFFTRLCPDPNCGGTLRREGDEWVCDGLTHTTDRGPLIACPVAHRDGDPRP